MASTVYSFYSFALQTGNEPPVALAAPMSQHAVMGSIIKLDGRNSYDPEGASLTYTWTFLEVPSGSELNNTSFDDLADGGQVVSFTPDVTGLYRAQLVVNDGQFDSAPYGVVAYVQPAMVPVCSDIIPDARFLLRTISDFWTRHFEQTDMLPLVWSGHMQATAAELLRLYEADHNKSIANIQELAQRKWLAYEPRLALDPTRQHFVFGSHQEGLEASTGPFDSVVRALAVSTKELRLVTGVIRPSAAGKEIEILTSNGSPGNTGLYTVAQVTKGLSGYILTQDSLLPSLGDDLIVSAADLVTTVDSDVVSSPSTNFAALVGFEEGDYLQVVSGANRGYYEIVGIGLADGLPDDNSLRLDADMLVTGIEDFIVHNVFEVNVPEELGPYTDVVYVSADHSDFDDLTSDAIRGVCTLSSPTEVIVGEDNVYEAAIGREIHLLDSVQVGTYAIGDVNDARDGYVLVGALTGAFPLEGVAFQINPLGTAAGRLVTLGDRTYTILRAYMSDQYPDPPTGPGDVGILVLSRPVAPSRLSALAWRVAATLTSSQYDFESLGVSEGDLLVGSVERTDTGARTEFYATVLGADGRRLAFETTRQTIVDGQPAEWSNQELVDLATGLGVTGVSLDFLGALTVLANTEASQIRAAQDERFGRLWGNVPITDVTNIDIGPFTIRLRFDAIVRNSEILVDEDVVAVPCLREYIRPPIVQDGDELTLLTRDGENPEVDQIPATMLENRDYTINDDTSITGRDGEFDAVASTFSSASGDFLRRRVRAGDTLSVEYGINAGDYVIDQVSSGELLVARADTAGPPVGDELDVAYAISRRVPGKYIRFTPDLWTPAEPAPDRLWAETTFLDNGDTIENNFGLMVALTQEQLSTRPTRSVTYKRAVEGLMYSFALGPTVNSIEVGANILLGLPVSLADGVIVRIEEVYSSTPDGEPEYGRITVEDTDWEGEGTGILRFYLFPAVPAHGQGLLTGIAVNPSTGTEYVVGDLVVKFAPLSDAAEVIDYVLDPTWWYGSFYQSGLAESELQKFHTWRLRANALTTHPDDFGVAVEFANAVKPAYTKLEAFITLYLVDEVTVEDDIYIHSFMHLWDDIAMSLEATAMEDNWNGGSLLLHHYDVGTLSSRLLFDGHDLVLTKGSNQATSARGGFTAVGVTQVPNPLFPDPRNTYATQLVAPGDLLFVIGEGANGGWYYIDDVLGDGTLQLDDVVAHVAGLSGPTLAGIQTETGLRFVLARIEENPVSRIASGSATAVGNVATLDGDSLYSDGVTADDILLAFPPAAAPIERYNIREVIPPPIGLLTWGDVRVEPTPSAALGDWEVHRRYMDPVQTGTASMIAGNPWVQLDARLAAVATRQWLGVTAPRPRVTILEGPSVGLYDVIDGRDTGEVCLVPTPPATGAFNAEFTYDHLDDMDVFDKVGLTCPEDTLHVAIYRPRTEIFAVLNLEVLATNYSRFSATPAPGFDIVPVVPGDFVEVQGTINSGIYPITAVTSATLSVAQNLALMAASPARILRDAADFQVNGAQVTVPVGEDLTLMGVRSGDLFHVLTAGAFPGGDVAVILEVTAPNVFTLTRNLGGPISVTGRIVREDIG
jgi:hypothetical protein